MFTDIESLLPEYGVINLIDVDGLLYAPVRDLWTFFRLVSSDRFAELALVLGGLGLIAWGIPFLVEKLLRLIRRLRKKTE